MEPEEVSKRSEKFLQDRGWVKWKCSAIDDTITVVNTRLDGGIPRDCPVYSVPELRILANSSNPVLIHEAVKLGGVIGGEE